MVAYLVAKENTPVGWWKHTQKGSVTKQHKMSVCRPATNLCEMKRSGSTD